MVVLSVVGGIVSLAGYQNPRLEENSREASAAKVSDMSRSGEPGRDMSYFVILGCSYS